jgi:phenylacetate-CoA ligase
MWVPADDELRDAFAPQFELLGRQLEYLREASAFYRDKLCASGIADNFVPKSPGELSLLPFTTKQEIRDSLAAEPPFGRHTAAPSESFVQVQSTSGTTGSPSYFGLTASDSETWSEMGARCLTAGGVRRGAVVMHAWGMGKGFAGGVPVVQMIQHLGACVVPVGAEAGAHRLLTIIRDLAPQAIVGTPSFLRYLGEQSHAILGVAAAALGVEVLVVGAEPGGGIPSVRAHLEELWGATCCEVLGNSDVAPLIWGECHERSGMHFLGQGHVLPELIEHQTGEPVAVRLGATGELVYTALTRQAAPLLRFRSGDCVEVLGVSCPCGRSSFKIRCTGRIDDMLIVRGVNVWPSAVHDVIVAHRPETTGSMRIIVDFEGHSTNSNLRVRVERGPSLGEDGDLAERLTRSIRSQLAFTPAIELVDTGSLETPGAAKARLVERVCS